MTNRISVPSEIRTAIFCRDDYSCQKCGFHSSNGDDLEVHHINLKVNGLNNDPDNLITLCSICHHYAPDDSSKFSTYVNEKVDWRVLDTFRKSGRSIAKRTKLGMSRKAREGGFITRAPLGYKLVNKQLVISVDDSKRVNDIFNEFLTTPISLTQLAKNHGFTTPGIIKLLKNRTYLGLVKFGVDESKGSHPTIVSEELFFKVQDKLNGGKGY